jgi:hypothetical protein
MNISNSSLEEAGCAALLAEDEEDEEAVDSK